MVNVLKSGKENGVPSNDLYGALYFHLRKEFVEFSRRLRTMNLQFTLIDNEDFKQLPKLLAENGAVSCKFDRIDVTAVTEKHSENMGLAFKLFGPLLKPVEVNPHAALITLICGYEQCRNRSLKQALDESQAQWVSLGDVIKQIFPDPEPSRERSMTDPYILRCTKIQTQLTD